MYADNSIDSGDSYGNRDLAQIQLLVVRPHTVAIHWLMRTHSLGNGFLATPYSEPQFANTYAQSTIAICDCSHNKVYTKRQAKLVD